MCRCAAYGGAKQKTKIETHFDFDSVSVLVRWRARECDIFDTVFPSGERTCVCVWVFAFVRVCYSFYRIRCAPSSQRTRVYVLCVSSSCDTHFFLGAIGYFRLISHMSSIDCICIYKYTVYVRLYDYCCPVGVLTFISLLITIFVSLHILILRTHAHLFSEFCAHSSVWVSVALFSLCFFNVQRLNNDYYEPIKY